jgi:hypothetical protein
MSTYGIDLPSPSEHDYHADRQQQRVEAVLKRLEIGDVLSIIDARIASEPDPKAHPLYELVNFLLDRQVAVDGAALYNRCRQLCLAAIDSALDDALEALED